MSSFEGYSHPRGGSDKSLLDAGMFEEIIEAHNRWVNSNGEDGKQADLRKRRLADFDLHGVPLRKADLRDADLASHREEIRKNRWIYPTSDDRSDLRNADFSEADLRKANLAGADLTGANLHAADLRGAILYHVELSECDLSQADLREANLSTVSAWDTNFTGADLRGALLSTRIYKKDVVGTHATVGSASFYKCSFVGANLSGTPLDHVSVSKSVFGGADIENVSFYYADLEEVDFRNARHLSADRLRQAIVIRDCIFDPAVRSALSKMER